VNAPQYRGPIYSHEMQRSILEADQEEESEESGDMNDDEINEMISRSEEETILYHEMDVQREREAAENWKAQGNRGKPPMPLIQLEELPDCYRSDAQFEIKEEEDGGPEGRGGRKRNVVRYHDGLSDEQWAMVCGHTWHSIIWANDGNRPSRKARTSKNWPSEHVALHTTTMAHLRPNHLVARRAVHRRTQMRRLSVSEVPPSRCRSPPLW
jgi:NADH:ubiquinone oxidoreductase subunit